MLDSELLRRFYVTAQSKNLTHAAKKLNMVQSAISNSIAALEAQLKTQLFSRTRAGLVVNAKGLELCDYVQELMDRTAQFEKKFHENEEKMEGDLTIITFPYIGTTFLIPLLKDFMKEYPNIKVHILVEPENVVPREADLAIGTFLENYPDLIQRPLMPLYLQLFASRDYLETYGVPKTEADLDNHFIISYEGRTYYSSPKSKDLALSAGSRLQRQANLSINSLQGMVNAIKDGQGIGQLPTFPSITEELEAVLPHLKVHHKKFDLYYIYNTDRETSHKIKILHTYINQKIRDRYLILEQN